MAHTQALTVSIKEYFHDVFSSLVNEQGEKYSSHIASTLHGESVAVTIVDVQTALLTISIRPHLSVVPPVQELLGDVHLGTKRPSATNVSSAANPWTAIHVSRPSV